MNNLNANYERILEVLKKISKPQLLPYQRRSPKMSDLELISLILTAKYIGIDSENNLFRQLPVSILVKIDRSIYNRRRRRLVYYIDEIRLKLASQFNEFEDHFIIDSMPLEVCKLSKSNRSTICKDKDYGFPDRGYCAAQASNYYGHKLHAVCSIRGNIQSIDLSPASVQDIHYLKEIREK